MQEVNLAEFVNDFVVSRGLDIPTTEEIARDLKAGKPNITNLVSLIDDNGMEVTFAADGMPLVGGAPNSYDHAPEEFRRSYSEYPRIDSPSRVEASEHGARINNGANKHLEVYFSDSISILRALSVARRRMGCNDDPTILTRELTGLESLDVLNGAISMWSFMKYRKEGRTPKNQLPPEVGLLHRSMSGVRMSLLSLMLHDVSHEFRKIDGWSHQQFNVDNWSNAVEESERLVGSNKDPVQLCPAPTNMIRRVMETVVEPVNDDTLRVADVKGIYGIEPVDLIKFGNAYFRIEQTKAAKGYYFHEKVGELYMLLAGLDVLTLAELALLELVEGKEIEQRVVELNEIIKKAFLEAVKLLGYKEKNFKL